MHLTLRVQLVDLRSKQVLATQEIDEVEAADSENAYAGVLAANRALKRVLEKVAVFCVSESAAR
jgi:cholesterol transport system auxiliary component